MDNYVSHNWKSKQFNVSIQAYPTVNLEIIVVRTGWDSFDTYLTDA